MYVRHYIDEIKLLSLSTFLLGGEYLREGVDNLKGAILNLKIIKGAYFTDNQQV